MTLPNLINQSSASEATTRSAIYKRRRWCPSCETHQDEDMDVCGATDCETSRLRIRRMIVCSECEQGYFNIKEFNEHQCYSAY